MRRLAFFVVPFLFACGDDTSGANGRTELVEFPYDQPVGEQRVPAWTVSPVAWGYSQCSSLTFEDGILAFHISTGELVKRGHGPATDAPIWSVPLPAPTCSRLHPLPDGGAIVLARATGTRVMRFGGDGSLKWDRTVDGEFASETGSEVLTSGDIALFVATTPAPGSLESPTTDLVILGGTDGMEKSRTKKTLLAGHPTFNAVAATPDGGVIAASATNALVSRFDAAGKLLWSTESNLDNHPSFASIAYLSDGSILATGTVSDEGMGQNNHTQALAAHYGGDGHLQWSKAYPFGPAPGATFAEGQTLFDAIVPHGGGAASVVMHVPSGCRLLWLESSGAITRVQFLDGLGSGRLTQCTHRALGSDLGYHLGATSIDFAKLTP